ncbi:MULTISPECIES: sigma E protease regulator RseP [Pseudoalteromonas]|jgi:regulator of sigma E protease|uniref:Zinc metalloprotease n=1 Tax=Pseudoalteromonas distincta TaxID=77608 RepID=A0ABT9GDW4_9GAMM|nr:MULTISPECIES: sigma E protease regulator RseP [Pseudoalteromonas]EGI74782.1 membrane-associated zinc metalloprotease [Pseudoalteromonas distincta]KAA1162392.1 sigma E protease regulator RseP [Pseudoalteromonas distincta]KHM44663.1 zinc metallopeptidase RseP [Pseudoalteromonas elyakovii]KID40300.1 zinc metallopeptidase RseP [Pseudoalteromonas distincta]MBB1276570.1 sigma E protease regulator RseP [Pseudoalteromonas sp. SR43-3]|tara:strand:+ start:40086 stop:41438 length:1353 start_codon:yes stop_codon:yes gene_type:complete
MFDFFWNLGSFILALGILVAIHEYGHFWVARKMGVKVLRFSIGFGKPLLKWHDKYNTEYVIAAIPLGGYVKMLDERVDDVPANQRHLSFNAKSVQARIAIVAAGPMANFLFAIFALAVMYMVGVQSVKPVVGSITEGSRAEQAGIMPSQHIIKIGDDDITTWQDATFALMSNLGEESVEVIVRDKNLQPRVKTLNLEGWKLDQQDVPPLSSLGIVPFRPQATLTIAAVTKDSAAEHANLQVNDTILAVNGETISNWQQLVNLITQSANKSLQFSVKRQDTIKAITVTPKGRIDNNGIEQGFLGVAPVVQQWPDGYVETRHYGPLDSIVRGTKETWRLITLSFDMIGNLITGQVSVKNLSGPVGIAVGAGTSVSYGLVAFLSFLALISVNLGVFNLLPLPVLDGGHLMYYIIELFRKKPVSEKTQEFGFKVGALLLIFLTCFALFNDVSRL